MLEEYSEYSRKLTKSALSHLDSVETELELADIKTGEVITNEKITDQNLTIKQLFYRYRGNNIEVNTFVKGQELKMYSY